MNLDSAILFLREVVTGLKVTQCKLDVREDNAIVTVINMGIHHVDDPVAIEVRKLVAKRGLNLRAGFNHLEVF